MKEALFRCDRVPHSTFNLNRKRQYASIYLIENLAVPGANYINRYFSQRYGDISPAQPHSLGATQYHYRAVTGVKMFDQEAEGAGTPVIVLLHRFPPFSHMYRDLISLLTGKFYVIAPDYPQRM